MSTLKELFESGQVEAPELEFLFFDKFLLGPFNTTATVDSLRFQVKSQFEYNGKDNVAKTHYALQSFAYHPTEHFILRSIEIYDNPGMSSPAVYSKCAPVSIESTKLVLLSMCQEKSFTHEDKISMMNAVRFAEKEQQEQFKNQ